MSLRLLFAGTPDFAVPALQALIRSGRPPLAVLTQPDRVAGRGRQLKASPIKQLAIEYAIPVVQPERLRGADVLAELSAFQPDLLITAAYGLILPKSVLDLPIHGCWNLHASLLPRWRGASPINQAILHGDASTGISLMQMDVGLDTGPVLATAATAIGADETAGELHDRLAPMAAELLLDSLERLEDGSLSPAQAQDSSLATHAPLISKADGVMDWRRPATELARQIRAYNPWPVAQAQLAGESLRIFRAHVGADVDEPAGTLIRGQGRRDAIIVACGQGSLEISELQLAGRARVSATDWLNARPDWR